eukprot:4922980-Lingulodinium_polyedra.AAC.1
MEPACLHRLLCAAMNKSHCALILHPKKLGQHANGGGLRGPSNFQSEHDMISREQRMWLHSSAVAWMSPRVFRSPRDCTR